MVCLLPLAILGLDTKQTSAYQVFTFLLSILIVAMFFSLFFRFPFQVRRRLPPFVTAGQTFQYGISIKNLGTKVERGLYLIDELIDPRPAFSEFISSTEPGGKRRFLFKRYMGYNRFLRLIVQKQNAVIKEQILPDLSPDSEEEIKITVKTFKRGYLNFSGIIIARPDPFGIFRAFVKVSLPNSLLILPKRYPLPSFQLPGFRKYQPGGVSLASKVGESEEFLSLRDYRPGDSIRRVHWKSWAKAGKPVVKEYRDEFFVRHTLILDTFLPSAYSEIFEEAVSVAASFLVSLQTYESLIDLMFVGAEVYCFTSGRGLSSMDRMLETLANVKLCEDKTFSVLHNMVIERINMLSGAICILIDWDEHRKNFIEKLNSFGLPLLVFVISKSSENVSFDPKIPLNKNVSFHILEMGKIKEGLSKIS